MSTNFSTSHHGRTFYLDAVEFVAFAQQAIDYAATAPMKLVDGAQLEKSMLRSLAGVPPAIDAL